MSTLRSLILHRRIPLLVIVGLVVVVILVVRTAPASAGVTFFGSLFAEREVEVKNAGPTQTPHDLHTFTWKTFAGAVPEGSTVDAVAVVLTWSPKEDRAKAVPAEVTLPVGEEPVVSQDIPPEEVMNEEVRVEEEASKTVEEEMLVPEEATEVVEEPALQVEDTPVVDESTPQEEVVPALEAEPATAPDTSEATPVESAAFLRVNTQPVHVWASEVIDVFDIVGEEQSASAISGAPVSEVSETFIEVPEEATSSEESVSNEPADEVEVPNPEAAPLYPTPEAASVQYSLDGDAWIELGTVDLVNRHDAVLPLGLDIVPAIDALQVRVVYLAPQDAVPLIFGNAQLQLSYTFVPVEPVIPAPSDQEPNFEVSAVKKDFENASVRAVLLERGGVFELWGALLERSTGKPAWVKLASGGAFNEDTPLAIKNDSIFWFDTSGNTFYVHDMKRGAITGATPQAGETILTVTFGDPKRPQAATYNLADDTFTFDSQ